MPKLYHFKPPRLAGNMLLPLATLRDEYPEVYVKALEKYKGRGEVPLKFIPLLDCSWEDVIFLSPVHPQVLHMELSACGYGGLVGAEAYVIDSESLMQQTPGRLRLVVYEFAEDGRDSYYQANEHLRYARISNVTRSHYRDAVKEGKRPFLFRGVTHAMYHGEICVDGLPVVRVRA